MFHGWKVPIFQPHPPLAEIAIRLAVRAPGREGSVGRVDLHHVGELRKLPAMLGTAPGEHRPWRAGAKGDPIGWDLMGFNGIIIHLMEYTL